MAKLTDFEELVSTIKKPLIKDYMVEAMTCYFAGAYRGCIVMSYIALFDDLFEKVKAIKSINSNANAIYKAVDKKRKAQDIYENYFIEQLASKKLISELDKDMCDIIKKRRHKSAHPTGHQPSAEEARFIFFEVIDKFLSKESLGTKHIVDEIISRLPNKYFFTGKHIKNIQSIVEDEIMVVHKLAFPYLITRLIDIQETAKGTIKNNASHFLYGLASVNNEEINLLISEKLLKKYLADDKYSKKCLSVISANPHLLKKLNKTAMTRFRIILKERIKSVSEDDASSKLTHPSIIFKRILNELGISYINENLPQNLKLIINKFLYRKEIISIVSKQNEKLRKYYINKLYKKASSSTFIVANEFIERLTDIEEEVSELLTNDESLRLLCEIIKSSKHGAWEAEQTVENKFENFKEIRSKALKYIKDSEEESVKIIKEELYFKDSLEKFKKRYLIIKKQKNA